MDDLPSWLLMMKKSLSTTLTAILTLVISNQIASAAVLLDDALQQYNAGRFTLAARCFSAAIAREPGKQLLHYYLANTLVRLGDHAKAAEQYGISYQLDSVSPVGEYSKQALLAYKKPLPAAFSAAELRKANYSASSKFATTNNVELDRTCSLIRKQADIEKNKHRNQSTDSQKVARRIAEAESRLVDLKADQDIQKLSEPIIYTPGPRANPLLLQPELLRQREEAIRKAAAEEKELILRHADERSQTYKTWEKNKATALDEVADNLETQLSQPAGRSGVKLQTQGTDLYVRYYGQSNGKKIAEVHSAVVRIVSQELGNPAEEAVNSETLQGEKADALVDPRSVRGKVLRKMQ